MTGQNTHLDADGVGRDALLLEALQGLQQVLRIYGDVRMRVGAR